MSELGPVVITARDIYDALVRLDTTVARVGDRMDEAHRDLQDHETRLRALERSRWPLPALSVLVAIGALLVALLRTR